jgi:hypothetical protein
MGWQVGPGQGNLSDPKNSLRTQVFRDYMTDQRKRKANDRALGMDRPISRCATAKTWPAAADTGEEYDLIVGGAQQHAAEKMPCISIRERSSISIRASMLET